MKRQQKRDLVRSSPVSKTMNLKESFANMFWFFLSCSVVLSFLFERNDDIGLRRRWSGAARREERKEQEDDDGAAV
jgi:hypothetical protein